MPQECRVGEHGYLIPEVTPGDWAIKICDLLKENLALCANIEFESEAILSVQVVSQLNSDYCTNVSQGVCTVSC